MGGQSPDDADGRSIEAATNVTLSEEDCKAIQDLTSITKFVKYIMKGADDEIKADWQKAARDAMPAVNALITKLENQAWADGLGATPATHDEKAQFFRHMTEVVQESQRTENGRLFDPCCEVAKALYNEVDLPEAGIIFFGTSNIRLSLIYDLNGNAIAVPAGAAKEVIKFVWYIQDLDDAIITKGMPVTFVLKHYLKLNVDFGLCRTVYTAIEGDDAPDEKKVDVAATIASWLVQHGHKVTTDAVRNFKHRLVAMRQFLTKHGVVKGYTLQDDEKVRLASIIPDTRVEEVFGPEPQPLDLDEEAR